MMRQPDDPGVYPVEPWEPFDAGFLVTILLAVAAIACLVIGLWARPAKAHEWFSDAKNPVTKAYCCNETDCRVLADDRWWREGGNYVVRWDDGKVYSIPVEQAMPSQDRQGRAAGCVWGGMLKCFFIGVLG